MKDFEDTDREGATMDSGKLNMAEEEDHGRPITDAAVRQAVECLEAVLESCGRIDPGDVLTVLAGLRHEQEKSETERLRLAVCGVAALGYFEGCDDKYKSASLGDVLRLRAVQAPRFPKAIDWHRWYMERSTRVDELLAEVERLKAHRLTGEQAKAVKNINRKTESRQCICGDGYLCARCEILGELRAAFPEAFEGEG